jgi:hypothetical protein
VRRVRLRWKIAIGLAAVLAAYALVNLTLVLSAGGGGTTRQASAAFQVADQTRDQALSAAGMHPYVWRVPSAYVRQQLEEALSIETRFTEQFRRIAFAEQASCQADQLLRASEDLKAAESFLIQESWTGSFSHARWQGYLDAIRARDSEDQSLRQALGLSPRLLFITWWPNRCG